VKYIYNVQLGKRFNHIVADRLAIKQNDVIAYRGNTIILTTHFDLLESSIKDRIARVRAGDTQ
jgi:hypothetical protein